MQLQSLGGVMPCRFLTRYFSSHGPRCLLQPQYTALHLAGGCHRQRVNKFNLFGVFVGGQQAFDMGLQLQQQFSIKLASSPFIN